jgi:L-iditol 2-dehydrogenase
MTPTMRAAILVAPKRVELRQVSTPVPGPGAIVVRVRAALTDGTDLKAYRRGHPQMPMPTRFGHEFSGDVVAVGDGVTTFAPGDAVMSVHSAPCGACYWCRNDEEELCESVMNTKILGAYAEYVEIPKHIVERNCYAKPDHLSYRDAAFLEPLACVVHSLDFLGAKAGAIVAVLGDGGFGLLHALALKARGCVPLLVGRRPERLRIAAALGVDRVIVAGDDVREAVRADTGGRGADAVIECTGSEDVWESAPSLVRRGGTVSFFGGLPSNTRVSFSAARLHYDEVRLISPFHFTTSAVRRAYELLTSDGIDVRSLVTHVFSLADIAAAFVRLDDGEGVKFAIEP